MGSVRPGLALEFSEADDGAAPPRPRPVPKSPLLDSLLDCVHTGSCDVISTLSRVQTALPSLHGVSATVPQ